jgi:signal transduction histidine kinase
MSLLPGFIRWTTLCLGIVTLGLAQETAWDARLTAFSQRWKDIQAEVHRLAPQLQELPGIPIDDQGGTGGYADAYRSAVPTGNARFAVEVLWRGAAAIDLVALVPARRYNAKGLDAQYGLPEAFTVELIDENGKVIRLLARERNARTNPVRKGHPFVYQVSPPVTAAGLRISANRLNPDDEGEGEFVHAWAEALAFEGERNVALGAKVQGIGGQPQPAPWHWNSSFLVDGQTPLGLPEIPAGPHANIGWISEGRQKANEISRVSIDLGESAMVDSVRLMPAKKPTSDLPSGFGFPRKLVIYGSETGADGPILAERDISNPGHNPVEITFPPTQVRHLKIEATELWKAFDDYAAFFALSEVEVGSRGKNIALGKSVQSQDGMMNLIAPGGRVWSAAALSDGFGPDGRLVPVAEWMLQMDKRTRIETRLHELEVETGELVGRWRRMTQLAVALVVMAGAFIIVILPIRYRVHASRELTKVRERIAGDLHDEVGSNLGSIQMFADLAEGRSGGSVELKRIQRIAAETVSAVRDIVWLLRPTGDHRIGTVEHLRETSSIMLESLKWKFSANEDAWQVELPEEANRDLFLFFRESLHNIMRHAKATLVEIRVEKTGHEFRLEIRDNGIGIASERLERPATLRALRQRAEALHADLRLESHPGQGTRLTLTVRLDWKHKRPGIFSGFACRTPASQ